MRNIEALRNYFLGKDPQLKETMADNSLRLIGIEGKHFVLRPELIKGLHDLKEHVDEKDVELQEEIDGLIRDLSSETTARENADRQIYLRMGDIDALLREDLRLEILARISGDNQLNTKFNNYYTKAQVDQLISIIPTFDIEVVEALPTEDISETTIYLVPSQDPQAANSYDEFIYVSNNWEQIGTTNIDLSNYYTKSQVDAKTFTTTLTADVHVPDNAKVTGLTQGWYFTGTHKVYFGNSVDASVYENALFYFYDDGEDQWFDFLPPNLDNGWFQLQTYLWYDTSNNIWVYGGYDIRDSFTSISDQSTDSTIPTSAAVYMAIHNNGEGIKEITSSTAYIEDQADGVYKVSKDTTLKVSPSYTGQQDLYSGGYLFVKTNSANLKAFVFLQPMISNQSGSCTMHHGYAAGANSQLYSVRLNSLENTANKVTTMTTASTDTQYPSAKCVYDAIVANGAGITTLTDNVVLEGLNPGIYYLGKPVNVYATSGGTLLYSHPSTGRANYLATMVVVAYGSASNGPNTCYIFPARKDSKVLFANTSYTTAATELDLSEISATAFTGTDGVTAGTKGLVPAPATTDTDKYLKSDGTWAAVQGGRSDNYSTSEQVVRHLD